MPSLIFCVTKAILNHQSFDTLSYLALKSVRTLLHLPCLSMLHFSAIITLTFDVITHDYYELSK